MQWKHEFKLNKEKSRFRVSEVSYVGHVLSSDGIKPVAPFLLPEEIYEDQSLMKKLQCTYLVPLDKGQGTHTADLPSVYNKEELPHVTQ